MLAIGENWKINTTTKKSHIHLTFIANNKLIEVKTGYCFPAETFINITS